MKQQELIKTMTHQMRCISGSVNIAEMEEDNKLKGLLISLKNDSENSDLPIILDKQELHRFIGVLLHIQAKMK
jgi:hypothetical protein